MYLHLKKHSVCESLVFCGDSGLKVEWTEDDEKLGSIISVPPEIYTKGCVQDVDDGLIVSKSDREKKCLVLWRVPLQ